MNNGPMQKRDMDTEPEEFEMPLLPLEAASLKEHVRGCSLRWNALAREVVTMRYKQDQMGRKLERAQKFDHAYRLVIIGLLGVVVLGEKADVLSLVKIVSRLFI